MPLAIRRLVGAWFGEDLKLQSVKAREQEHVKKNIEFVKDDPDLIKALGRHLLVGRLNENHIILNGKHVADKHCEITEHRIDQWYIKALQSEAGVYIKRDKGIVKVISGEFKIEKGDHIIIGEPENKREPATFLEIVQA